MNGAGRFYNPYGLVVGADGTLFVADTYNELVRMVLAPFKLTLQISGTTPVAIFPGTQSPGKNIRCNSGIIGWQIGQISA